jgi:hypothetical protein
MAETVHCRIRQLAGVRLRLAQIYLKASSFVHLLGESLFVYKYNDRESNMVKRPAAPLRI